MLETIKSRDDLPRILNHLGLTGSGVEVGVQRGHFSEFLLRNWLGKKLYMVDIWRQVSNYNDIANVNHMEQLECMAEAFRRVYEFHERAVMIRSDSAVAAHFIAHGELDFVYLDGDHSYEGCKKDLEVWWDKLKPGGIFCGDDYLDSPFEKNGMADFGVKRAVDEFAVAHNLKLHITYDEIISDTGSNQVGAWFAVKTKGLV